MRHSGVQTLVGQFVGMSGSARPISHVEFTGGEMRFSIPPQWERVDGNLVVTGRLDGDRLVGSMALGAGAPLAWTGVRAPSLRRQTEPRWGAPVPIFNGRDLAGWHAIGANEWEAANGILRNRKSGGNQVTDHTFTDFKLHAEFRLRPGGIPRRHGGEGHVESRSLRDGGFGGHGDNGTSFNTEARSHGEQRRRSWGRPSVGRNR